VTRDNILYLVIGVLALVGLGYRVYPSKQEPKGFELNIRERGISIEPG